MDLEGRFPAGLLLAASLALGGVLTALGAIAVSRASLAAQPFAPVTITTDKLTITGGPSTYKPLPFTPVTITTDKLTITGLKP